MNSVEPRLRPAPRARAPFVDRIAFRVLGHELANLQGGTLRGRLPDGTERSFGSGPGPAVTMHIHDGRLFRRLATRPKLGLGESYTADGWDCDDLVGFFQLLILNADAARQRNTLLRRVVAARPRPNRRNGCCAHDATSPIHYDLGNELFALKRRPQRSTGSARSCNSALTTTCLRSGGWGSFAIRAAQATGSRVTGLTISAQQATLARERIGAAGLADRITILEQDYRQHQGRYTKISSIEMLEAIGERQFGTYFAAIDRLLEPNGIACVQTILIPDQLWDRYRKTPDWIEQYIFPGCLIPSLTALTAAATRSSRLAIHEVHEIGPHYAETLRQWRANLRQRQGAVRALGYDTVFERTWDFYLAFCEAGFRTRALRDAQLTLTRSGDWNRGCT